MSEDGSRARPYRDFMIRFCSLVVIAVCAVISGCSNGFDVDAGNDFVAPIDSRENEAEQGIYDCTERGDTGYRQGSSFAIRVVNVDGKPLEVATANAYLALQEAARAGGVTLRVVSGFRTMEQQEYFYGCYTNCNCNNCNEAARPGYSNHQSGHALDLNTADGGVLAWLNNHGAAYGWSRTVPSEAWHWEWWGAAADYDGPCGEPPIPAGCSSGNYDGAFCDDDGASSEDAHDCLVDDLAVDFHCADVGGHDAYCGDDGATRSQALFVLATAARMPLVDPNGAAWPNAFTDDNGHALEATLNAGKHWGILLGSNGNANPDGAASRSTIALLLRRIYDLPPATRDFFSDDDGTDAEDAHNRVAEHLGFSYGCGAGEGDRRRFCPADRADRSALARFACGSADATPLWERPAAPEPTPEEPTPEEPTPQEPAPDEPKEPVIDDPDGPAPVDVGEEALPESEPAALDLAPSVAAKDGGCAQTATTTTTASTPALLLFALLLLRRRR